MHPFDWTIVITFFVFSALIGVYYTKRAGKNIQEFFLSGRNLPWWLAGSSMVATTFAADTPLAVTELVAKNGIAGNWMWWNFIFGSILTVFFFSRLWRRANILTDIEFVELRYSGKAASFLRGFRALYLGLFINCIIIGWVNLAIASVLEGMFSIPKETVILFVALALLIAAVYSALSGMWGIAVTDMFQFALAMIGSIILAIIVLRLPQVGGIVGLKEHLPQGSLRFLPVIDNSGGADIIGTLTITVGAFLAFAGMQWWACWYPGAEPGGGGYVAQRMMSAKDEKHSLFATLWFTIAHYCVRPWPWIIVGLATLVLYPEIDPESKRLGYVYAMRDHLPTGFKGMLVAAFFAAYMSTISTQLNWGTSYVVNDFYKRFFSSYTNENRLVFASRLITLVIMALSLVTTMMMDTISGAWAFIIEAGAGLGLVLILRWFWWRINAWSEIAAMVVPMIVFGIIKFGTDIQFPESLFYIVSVTTVAWIIVTFLTKPTNEGTLKKFYQRVHPGGVGWKYIATQMPEVKADSGYGGLFLDWIAGIVLVYSMLFGVGKLLLGDALQGIIFMTIGLIAASVIYLDLSKRGFNTVMK